MATVDVDIKKLLEAGAHFGHKTSRWHPKMAPYIHSKRGGSHIIDLTKTVEGLDAALAFLTKTVSEGKQVLVVGTKRQTQGIVKQLGEEAKQPFVTERWMGGMLTNWQTMQGRVKHLKDLETKMESGELASKYSKLEVQRAQEEIDAMNEVYGGIKNMAARPGAVLVFDVVHDHLAVKEANKLGLPVVALIDSNADPSVATHPVPCNDDALKTVQLIASYVKQAIEAGKDSTAKDAPAAKESSKEKESAAAKGEDK